MIALERDSQAAPLPLARNAGRRTTKPTATAARFDEPEPAATGGAGKGNGAGGVNVRASRAQPFDSAPPNLRMNRAGARFTRRAPAVAARGSIDDIRSQKKGQIPRLRDPSLRSVRGCVALMRASSHDLANGPRRDLTCFSSRGCALGGRDARHSPLWSCRHRRRGVGFCAGLRFRRRTYPWLRRWEKRR